jgi:hypothetical protein
MSASFDANLAYALCYWVDSGGNLPSGWEVIWSPTGPAAGYTVVFQNSGQATYAIVSQGTKDVWEALLECEVAHQDPFPYITGNAKVARGNLDLLKITLDLKSSTGVRLGDVLPALAQAKNQILVTGHSLGAATATLMAPYVGFLINGGKPITALPSNVTGMTFGTPAVGDSSFANFLNNNPSNYTSYNNANDAVPCLWSMTGEFSIPNMYLLFAPPGPHPMPEGLKLPFQNIVNNMKKNNVSYQQTKTVTFTFASIPETGKDPWLTELMYQHNTAYDIQFGIITNAAITKGTTS